MPEAADRVAAETWFLRRGLPSVLTPRARWRRLWTRSAPALAGFAAIVVCATVANALAGNAPIDIGDDPTAHELLILAVVGLTIPLVALACWRVSRITGARSRRNAATLAVAVAWACSVINGSIGDRVQGTVSVAIFTALILVANGIGVGSVLGWAMRLTASHLTSVGALTARALPVVLLTVLVFFNGFVWSMATKISRDRMWLVIAFLVLIATAFLVSGIVERVRPMLAKATAQDTDTARLADTPFAAMPNPEAELILSRGERVNVMFVVAASQMTQVAMVAAVTAGIFFVLGLLTLSPELLATWTNNGPDTGTWLGMTLPVPQSLIHVTMFLGALTFMYVSARSVGDGEYRKEFLDPLVDDLRLTLVARNRYRTHVAGGG